MRGSTSTQVDRVFIHLTDSVFAGTIGERYRKVLPSMGVIDSKLWHTVIEDWELEQFISTRYNEHETFILIFGITELSKHQNYNTIFNVADSIKNLQNIKLKFINDYDLYDHIECDREDLFAVALQHIEQHRLEFALNNTLTVEKFKTTFPDANVHFTSRFLTRFFSKVADPFEEYTGLRQKHFLCLNSRITEHRDAIFNKVQPLNNSHLSYRLRHVFLDEVNPWNTRQQEYFKQHPESSSYAPDTNNEWAYQQDKIDKAYYQDSYVYICTDSLFAGLGNPPAEQFHKVSHWWTEKLLKSFYYKLPVIQVGLPHSLSSVRSLGFRTFGAFWDESYDREPDPKHRMNRINEVIDQLSCMTLQDLDTMYHSNTMQEILNHNHELMLHLNDKYKSS